MTFDSILWDADDDAVGNVQHCAKHGVTKSEVEEVLQNITGMAFSRSSGLPVVFGDTLGGRHLIVVYKVRAGNVIDPLTAYDVPKRRKR